MGTKNQIRWKDKERGHNSYHRYNHAHASKRRAKPDPHEYDLESQNSIIVPAVRHRLRRPPSVESLPKLLCPSSTKSLQSMMQLGYCCGSLPNLPCSRKRDENQKKTDTRKLEIDKLREEELILRLSLAAMNGKRCKKKDKKELKTILKRMRTSVANKTTNTKQNQQQRNPVARRTSHWNSPQRETLRIGKIAKNYNPDQVLNQDTKPQVEAPKFRRRGSAMKNYDQVTSARKTSSTPHISRDKYNSRNNSRSASNNATRWRRRSKKDGVRTQIILSTANTMAAIASAAVAMNENRPSQAAKQAKRLQNQAQLLVGYNGNNRLF